MAKPKCSDPNCDSTVFKMTEIEPLDANFKVNAIHCNKCGCTVGITEHLVNNVLITNLAKALNVKIST